MQMPGMLQFGGECSLGLLLCASQSSPLTGGAQHVDQNGLKRPCSPEQALMEPVWWKQGQRTTSW